MLRISGVDLPTPSTFVPSIMDLVKAQRNANGKMIKEKIATKRKLEITYKYLSVEDVSIIFKLLNSDSFIVKYIDPEDGDYRTGEFYSGNRKVNAMDYINGVMRWKDISFNIIEM